MAKHGEPEQKPKGRGHDLPPAMENVAEATPAPAAMRDEPPKPRLSPRVKAAQEAAPPEPPPAAEPPQAQPSVVRLEVFCRLTGIKWDRLAAFKHWAKKRKIGPMPVKAWWKELEKFQKRPVG